VPTSSTFRERVGRRICALRTERGLSQTALARQLPGMLDSGQISRWERGRAMPTIEHLEQLARALDVSEERVVCGCDP
jgi:transcriptional regulator with XRE-family HTH domain